MTPDPNALPEPDEQEPVAPEPQAPQVDLDAAYRVVADNEGWDPRLARFEMQELKRRKDEMDQREREFDKRSRVPERPDPTPDFGGDQYARLAYEAKQEASEVKRLFMEEREERKAQRERDELVSTIGRELDSAFKSVARQAGMTKEQIAAQAEDFYSSLTDIYPEPEMIKRMGADRAVRNAFRVFRGGNGSAPQPRSPYRDPRASFVIPSGSSGGPMSDDSGPRRSNESQEEYVARLRRVLDEGGAKLSTLPERAVINPG